MRNFDHLLGFFDAAILSVYRSQPDKYSVETDYFSGTLSTTDKHFEQLSPHRSENKISLRFGFRTRSNDELVLAVWMPDFENCSSDERTKWIGFEVERTELVSESDDTRYRMWVQRYLEGNWHVEDGGIARTRRIIKELNALTFCAVGRDLYKFRELEGVQFPMAQNSHRYQDAHAELYKLLIDGLDIETLVSMASRLNIALANPKSERTIKLLKAMLPAHLHGSIIPSFDDVSSNRRLAAHHARPAPEKVDAFEMFSRDLVNVNLALECIKSHFSSSLGLTVDSCVKRVGALSMAYEFDDGKKLEANYSIWDTQKAKGKTITDVQVGWRKCHPEVHESEMIVLTFQDGSSMTLTTGSNFQNISRQSASDLEVSFQVQFVPPVERI
jgi:hypothetical protein